MIPQKLKNVLNSNGIMTQQQRNQANFDAWMRDKVKSIYYADQRKMAAAFERIQ